MNRNATFIVGVILSIVTLSAFVFPVKLDGTYKVDPQKSEVDWKGEKVTGKHNGQIQIENGALEFANGELKGGNFEIDMTSITNKDLEGEYNTKLVNHLKSDDFFGTEKFPTSKFVITKVEKVGGNKYNITGDLTIKSTTEEIEFPATVIVNENQATANAEIVVDRSKYDVRYGSTSFFDNLGDKVIYDEFHLNVNLVANNEIGK